MLWLILKVKSKSTEMNNKKNFQTHNMKTENRCFEYKVTPYSVYSFYKNRKSLNYFECLIITELVHLFFTHFH